MILPLAAAAWSVVSALQPVRIVPDANPDQAAPPAVSVPYAPAPDEGPADVSDMAVDARGRLWCRRGGGAVRLDDGARVVEEVRFNVRKDPPETFILLADGTFLVDGYHLGADGSSLAQSPLPKFAHVAAALGDGLVVLTGRGLRLLALDGTDRGEVGRYGYQGATAGYPRRVAAGGGRVAVVVDGRIDILREGEGWPLVGSLGQGTSRPWVIGTANIAFDSEGWLYLATGYPCSETVDVFDANLDHVITMPLRAWQLAVDAKGRIHAACFGKLATLVPVGEGAHGLAGTPVASPPRTLPVSVHRIAAEWKESRPLPFRVHVDGRAVHALAWDPGDPMVLWMGTDGGVLRFDRAAGSWRRFGPEQGLPVRRVLDIGFDASGRALLVAAQQPCRIDVASGRIDVLLAQGAEFAAFGTWRRVLRSSEPAEPPAFAGHSGILADLGERGWQLVKGVDNAVLPIPRTGDFLALHEQDIVRVQPREGRATVVAAARGIADVAAGEAHPISPRALASIGPDRWGARAWVAVNGVGIVPMSLTTGALDCALGPPPARDFAEGGDALAQSAVATFAIGRNEIGRLDGGSIRWLWVLHELDARAGWPTIERAVIDPLDPEVLWLALATGACRLDTRSGALELHAPPDGDMAQIPDPWIGEVGGKLWAWREPVPGPELGGIVAREVGGGPWRPVAGLPPYVRLAGTDRDGLVIATESVDYERGAWRIDPARLIATPFRAGQARPAEGTWAVVDDGTALLSLSSLAGTMRLCSSSGDAPECTDLAALGDVLLGVRSMVLDPANPRLLWLAGPRGLVRFDRDALTAEAVGQGAFSTLELVAGRYLWADDPWSQPRQGAALRWDLQEGKALSFSARGPRWPDPFDPGRAWVALPDRLELVDIRTSSVIETRDVPGLLGLPSARRLRVTRGGDQRTAWVSSEGGLAEIPLDEKPPAAADP